MLGQEGQRPGINAKRANPNFQRRVEPRQVEVRTRILQARASSYKRVHEQRAVGKHVQAGVVSRGTLEALLDRLQTGQPLCTSKTGRTVPTSA